MIGVPPRPATWRGGTAWGSKGVLWHAGERASAAALMVLASPVLVGCGLMILALSSRSPLIAHRRIGQNGRPFWMLKLRTMWRTGTASSRFVDRIESEPVPPEKTVNDDRVSGRFARFCRRHSLDELPQLFHILTGEMTFIGPRPLTATELELHYGEVIEEVVSARPGLTGLWQVAGGSRLTYAQRRRLDLFLVRRPSARLHRMILLRTIQLVVTGKYPS